MDGLGWTIIARYLENSCTAAERDAVERWASENPRNREELESVRCIWIHAALLPSGRRIDAMFDELSARIEAPALDSVESQAKKVGSRHPRPSAPLLPRLSLAGPRANPWRRIGAIAAAAVVTILAGSVLYDLRDVTDSQVSEQSVREYHTVAGQRARITLPDSSTVILAPETHIRYAANPGAANSRMVTLDGQALFTVTHAAGVPFIVHAHGVTTHVLGTSFSVRSYATDTAVQVVVAQGRVAVGSTVLGTGDVAMMVPGRAIAVSRGTAVTEQLAWTEGRLVFSGVLLRDAIPELERWYGIAIEVTDPILLDRLVTTTLGPTTPSRAMELVAFVVEGRLELDGSRAIIHSH
jgi:transmembrane sensor